MDDPYWLQAEIGRLRVQLEEGRSRLEWAVARGNELREKLDVAQVTIMRLEAQLVRLRVERENSSPIFG